MSPILPRGHTAPPGALEDALALLRAWGAGRTAEAAPATPVTALLALARAHQVTAPVAAALAPVVPAAARALLIDPLLEEEAAEAAAQAALLAEVAATLNGAGVTPAAMKGSAFLAQAGAGAGWRRMVDLDLLVAAEALPDAVAAMKAAGWSSRDEEYVATDYHYPAFFRAGCPWIVELHTGFDYFAAPVLAGARERAGPSALSGVAALGAEDRLAQMVHHGMVKERGWRRRVPRLRDALDWRALTAARPGPVTGRGAGEAPADPKAVRARFAAAGWAAPFDAFAAFAGLVWDGAPGPGAPAEAVVWARTALAGLVDPASIAPWLKRDDRRQWLEAATSAEALRHIAAGLASAGRRRRFLRRFGGA